MHTPRAWTWIKTALQGHTSELARHGERNTPILIFKTWIYYLSKNKSLRVKGMSIGQNHKPTHPAASLSLRWPSLHLPSPSLPQAECVRTPPTMLWGSPPGAQRGEALWSHSWGTDFVDWGRSLLTGYPISVGELERSLILLDKEFVSDMLRWLFMTYFLKKHSSVELKINPTKMGIALCTRSDTSSRDLVLRVWYDARQCF